MPDAPSYLAERYERALSEVGEFLKDKLPSLRELNFEELATYADRQFSCGWEAPFDFENERIVLRVLVTPHFPYEVPRVGMQDGTHFLQWPHVEKDGILCELPLSASVAADQPVDVVRNVLGAACELVADSLAGSNTEDFGDEFQSYWSWNSDDSAVPIWSLLKPSGPSRAVKAWLGKERILVCDDEAEGDRWLCQYYPVTKPGSLKFKQAGFIWLPKALSPSRFPETSNDLLSIVKSAGAEAATVVAKLVKADQPKTPFVLAFDTENGPAMGTVVAYRPKANGGYGKRKADPVTKGFRPGKVPPEILIGKYLQSPTKLGKHNVKRIDAAWLHGRAADTRQSVLREMSVTIIGLGAIGATVAKQLAQAGVGTFSLIDKEVFDWPNVGRHLLGAQAVGQWKTNAVSSFLKTNFPSVSIERDDHADINELLRGADNMVFDTDLILDLTGDWASQKQLNEIHRMAGHETPIIYGWTDAYGLSGQSVAVVPDGACLECGLNAAGRPLLSPIHRDEGVGLIQEPACGAVFQPFGPVELGHTHALIAGQALDVLLGKVEVSQQRLWIGPRQHVQESGGEWSNEWMSEVGDPGGGSIVLDTDWKSKDRCDICGGA